MSGCDVESEKYNAPLRYEERKIRKAAEDAARAAKYGFGDDDDDDEEEEQEEGGEGGEGEVDADGGDAEAEADVDPFASAMAEGGAEE